MNPTHVLILSIVPVALVVALVLALLALIVVRRAAGPAARITVDGAELRVRLGVVDKVLAFHGDVRVPVARVQRVEVVDRPFTLLRGIRAPGTGGVPGVAYGTWRYTGARDFVALVGRGPAVVITASDGAPYKRLVVSVPDPHATAALISAAVA